MRALLVVAVLVLAAGCVRDPPPATTSPPATTTPPTPGPEEAGFSGERALDLVRAQVLRDDGTVRHRVPGTAGNHETAAWIADRLDELEFDVAWHHFNATYGCETTPMHNVIGERAGTTGRVVVFAAHYDTRPIADKDPDPAKRDAPIPGAIDGASGVAVLLELARVLPPTQDTVRLVFFDGEDGGGYKGRACTDWVLGSIAYAESLNDDELAAIRAFVLVDMVGAHDMLLPYEGYSRNGHGRALQEEVYDVAHALGHGAIFLKEPSFSIIDDHVAFLDREVPAIDLIHLVPGSPQVFPAWHHTHADDLDAISAASLDIVGDTLEAWVRGLGDA